MSDQRNMILAIVLSAIVLFGWGFVTERWFPTANEPSTKVVEGKQVALPKPGTDPTADAPGHLVNGSFSLPQHWVNTFIGGILIGAVLIDIWIRQQNIVGQLWSVLFRRQRQETSNG